MPPPIRKAIFPVAGLGTRFLPATKVMPKEMLPLVDRPLIQHAVDEARAAGVEEFIFVSGDGKQMIDDHFGRNNRLNIALRARGKTEELRAVQYSEIPSGNLCTVRQNQPLGLGHAIWCARHLIGKEPFAILLPDDVILADTPCLKQMVDMYQELEGNVVAVTNVPREQTSRYGVLDIAEGADVESRVVAVKGLVEKPEPDKAPSTLAIIGRYILQPEIFDHLALQQIGAGGEIQLTDAMEKLIVSQPFYGFRFEGKRYDCGDKVGFLEANIAFALKHPDLKDRVRAVLTTLLETGS